MTYSNTATSPARAGSPAPSLTSSYTNPLGVFTYSAAGPLDAKPGELQSPASDAARAPFGVVARVAAATATVSDAIVISRRRAEVVARAFALARSSSRSSSREVDARATPTRARRATPDDAVRARGTRDRGRAVGAGASASMTDRRGASRVDV